MNDYELLLDRVATLALELEPTEREHAARVVQLCRELAERRRETSQLQPDPGDAARKKELGRLTELLGRRASKALPAATLARAALADLSFDRRSFEAACADCAAKLAIWGR
jgi:hypothetical protein